MKSQLWGEKVCAALRYAQKWVVAALGAAAFFVAGTASAASDTVAKIGETGYSSLSEALKAAIAANDGTPVEIQRDITFAPGDTWTPVVFGGVSGRKLVVDGKGHTIANLPGMLLDANNSTKIPNFSVLEMSDLTFLKPRVHTVGGDAAVILGCTMQMRAVTLKNVVIDGAEVRNAGDHYTGGFLGYCNGRGSEPALEILFEGCVLKNSLVVGGAATGGLMAHTGGETLVTVRIVDTEVVGNTIITTELKDGRPRAEKVGSVIATLGANVTEMSATVSGNTVYAGYGTVDDENDTEWKKGVEVTTVYGRRQSETLGTLSLTGGSYDARPFNEADASWATVAEGFELRPGADNTYAVSKVKYVAQVGDKKYASLAAALKAGVETGKEVSIIDDITFDENDSAWETVALKSGSTLVVKGNGHTIENLPGMLLDVSNGGAECLRMSDLKFVAPKAVDSGSDFVAVILGYADYTDELTFTNVSIEGATVTGNEYVAAFVAWAALVDGDSRVTFTGCKVTGSTLTGGGSTGALMGHANCAANGTVTVVDCEISGNTITCTEAESKKAGTVFGTVGDAPAFVSAKVERNVVKSGNSDITTVCGRLGHSDSTGTLTLTGGTYDTAPIAGLDLAKAGVSANCTLKEAQVDGKTVYTVAETAVAKIKVGEVETEYADLAAALKAAVSAKNATVTILRDITFGPNDTWTPVRIGSDKTLVVNGNGKTIKNLPGCLFGSMLDTGDVQDGSSLTMTNLKFVNPKKIRVNQPKSAGPSFAAVVLALAYGMDVTFDGVEIEGADVRGGDDCFVAGFVGWCNGMSGGNTVTLRNCALRNSTLVSCGSAGGLVAYTTVTPNQAVELVIENCEVTGNTIVCTELKDGAPRTDIVGSVVASIGAGDATVSATVSGNSVYGSTSAVDAETLTKDTDEVTAVYGRGNGGELTIAGGSYDKRPFNAGDDWAKVAKGYKPTVNNDGTWSVTMHVVAKVGDKEFNSLADALNAAITHRNADDVVVKIVDDIKFETGDTWTPVMLGGGQKLVIDGKAEDGSNHVIEGLPASLAEKNGSWQVLRVSNLTFKSSKVTGTVDNMGTGVLLGMADSMLELTFDNVVIDGANVQAVDWAGAFVGYAAGYSDESNGAVFQTVMFRNCKVQNSTVKSSGSVGALIGHASGSTYTRVVVENAEIRDNVIECTRENRAGAVFGTVGEGQPTAAHPNGGLFVDANVSGNTVTSGGQSITMIYGRRGNDSSTGTLTLTGGSYDKSPFNEGDDWATVAKGYDMAENDGTWSVTMHVVAKVGDKEFNSLADALKAAIAANDGVAVEIVDDITFADGDTWTPVVFSRGKTLVVNGNGKTITGLPEQLLNNGLDVEPYGNVLRISNLTFLNPKASTVAVQNSAGEWFGSVGVILGYTYGLEEVTLDGVVIDGADVRGHGDCFAAGFLAWCNGFEGVMSITIKNCALRNSTIVGGGSAGGLIAFTSNDGNLVDLTVENTVVENNTIVCTEAGRTDKAGAVIATIGASGAKISATTRGNKVYSGAGAVADTNDTNWKTGTEITTVYGRHVSPGTLTLTGGTYDARPFNDGDDWAKVGEWSELVEQDGVFKVVDNLATLGNVKARQRYPWNGLVDVTFELKSKNAARVFIVAEYVDGGETKRLPMAAAKLVNDDKSESDVNVSTGFTVSAQATAKTIHVIWDSTAAVPTRLSGVTFKVYAK